MPKPSRHLFPLFPLFPLFLMLASACASEQAATQPGTPAAPPATTAPPPSEAPPAEAKPLPTHGIVACFYDEARAAGVAILEEGGSASDAFVAITLVDYVRAAGETSLGGPLGAMTYDAKTGAVESLDATFDSVHDPAGLFDPNAPSIGASVLVPGALRGLDALAKAKGKLPWARLVAPAIKLAAEGYAADAILVGQITSRRAVLERSAYAKALYLPGNEPIAIGTLVKQPELAAFLEEVAQKRSSAMYDAGAWAESFVSQVNALGGKAALGDLSGYEAKWQAPWTLDVRGKKVFTNSGRAYGGVYGLLGLSVLAHDVRAPAALSETDRVEVRLRTARALYDDPWFYDASKLDDAVWVKDHLADTSAIWSDVAAQLPAKPKSAKGTHSLHVTVIDRNGDAVTGTNTLNSMPWGSGIFVRGSSLTEAGSMAFLVPGAGQRVVTPLTLHVVESADKTLRFIGGAFGSSLLETELQVLADATLGESLTAKAIAARPRFGTFPYDVETAGSSEPSSNWISNDAPELAKQLEARGLKVKRDPYGDTGWGTFALREPDGALVGGKLDETWFRAGVTALEK
jgi:gamma-glutamyltranspeptidase/glutathione hydrolase